MIKWKYFFSVEYISPIVCGYYFADGRYASVYAGFLTADWTIQDIEDWLLGIERRFEVFAKKQNTLHEGVSRRD